MLSGVSSSSCALSASGTRLCLTGQLPAGSRMTMGVCGCLLRRVRVFFESNVLVSAFLARSLCADLLRLVLSEHTQACTDPSARARAATSPAP
jgi:hypothetical protein